MEDQALFDGISDRFAELNRDLIFIHSDIRYGFAVERPEPFDRLKFLSSHFEAINGVTHAADLWFPTFNYGYTNSRKFDQRDDRSQMGHLSEHVRCHASSWRTYVPVFSICGTGKAPDLNRNPTIDAFGTGSIFHQIVTRDGLIFNYGCDLTSLTFLHYSESIAGIPYRYQKEFPGRLIDFEGTESDVVVRFHVRPLDREMTYDWPRLQADLLEEGMLESVGDDDRSFQILRASFVNAYWQERLDSDPLFFLTKETRVWVEPMLDQLGRPFELADFESTE